MVLLLPLGGEVFLRNTLVCLTGEFVLLWSKLVGELRLEFPLLLCGELFLEFFPLWDLVGDDTLEFPLEKFPPPPPLPRPLQFQL